MREESGIISRMESGLSGRMDDVTIYGMEKTKSDITTAFGFGHAVSALPGEYTVGDNKNVHRPGGQEKSSH